METTRKPFQGVSNIISFNRHFFISALIFIVVLRILYSIIPHAESYIAITITVVLLLVITPLIVSWYVYDISGIYQLYWIKTSANHSIANINAGFDETSVLLHAKNKSQIQIFDFYNPAKHTEVSIKRARKAYPPHPDIQYVSTDNFPLEDECIDSIVLFMAAHEIRDMDERTAFFSDAKRIIKPEGIIYVTEHLRDVSNFIAYNIGFLHFHSKKTWLNTFNKSGLHLQEEIKNNPFVTTFILTKNGNTL